MTSSARLLAIFLILISLLVLGYVGVALYRVYSFNRLSAGAPLEQVDWSVKAINDEKYQLLAHYKFQVNSKLYYGETLLSERYRNEWAAEQGKKELSLQYQTVWYDPADPNHSSIEKAFPTKNVIYAAILFVLLNYFVWGGYFYTKRVLTQGGQRDDGANSFKK